MALFEEQITDTLETGAPPIKYEGDEGPQDPRQERMIAQLKEEYMQYVFERRELEEPILSFEEWYQSVYKASQMGAQAPQEEMMSEEMMMREPAAYGGIMDTESGRRAYGLGSIFKKITNPIKKVVKGVASGAKKIFKSPVGKMGLAALLAGPALGALSGTGAAGLSPGALGGKLPGVKGFLARTMGSGKAGLGSLLKKVAPKTLAKIGIGATAALPLLGIGTEAKVDQLPDTGAKFDYDYNKMRDRFAKAETEADFAAAEEEFPVTPGLFKSRFYDMKADGGRIGYAEGDMVEKIKEGIMEGGRRGLDEAIWIEKIKDFIRKKRGDPREEISEELEVWENFPGQPLQDDQSLVEASPNPQGRRGYALGSKADFAIEDVMTGVMEDELGGITGIMRQADLQRKGNVGQFYAAEGGMPMMQASYGYDDAMAESYDEFQRLRKLGEIPLDLEFDEWLEMQDVERHMKLPSEPRTMAQEGGIMDLGGMEKDYRETGGFVDIGAEEKADDVPARLSVNEFVMTADAVRGAGDGDIDLGAERMEDTMKQLEQKGQQYAGGGLRGEKAQEIAEMIAQEQYGMEFYDLPFKTQMEVYELALDMYDNRGANKGAADMFEVSERLSEVV